MSEPGTAAAPAEVVLLDRAPSLPRLYARALRPRPHRPASLPSGQLELAAHATDLDHLAAYSRVCGFRVSDRLPPTYPHVLAFPLQVQLMTGDDFPFGLAGMVHIRNVITQHRPLDATDLLRIRVRAERLAPHDKGAQVDLVNEVYVDDEPVWVSRSTYLARDAAAPPGAPEPSEEEPHPDPSGALPARWLVPRGLGRRSAAVSGDINPIHLHSLAARLFGFRGAIAHGMWTKAHCLAALGPRVPPAMTADVSFRRPLPLGSSVRFLAAERPAGWDVAVVSSRRSSTHLSGSVRAS